MYISILGRLAHISLAELARLYGSQSVRQISDQVALVSSDSFDFERLGGSKKAGRVIIELPGSSWHKIGRRIIDHYSDRFQASDHKITLGISVYGLSSIRPYEIQRLGLDLKQKLKKSGVSLRLIPNAGPALSTATSHHNKLGLSPNKIELIIATGSDGHTYVAESVGAQNITALAARDQARPYTDARVGMLPPKLARIMINLATGDLWAEDSRSEAGLGRKHLQPELSLVRTQGEPGAKPSEARLGADRRTQPGGPKTILDPFCGTGVVLQEAMLMGYQVIGSDLSAKMADYSERNIAWLRTRYPLDQSAHITQADAISYTWPEQIDYVASEIYLGKPFASLPPLSRIELERQDCDKLLADLLNNLSTQLPTGTTLCLAIPAWQIQPGQFLHLPTADHTDQQGFRRINPLPHTKPNDLVYYRENQVVGRLLLVLEKV